MPRVHLAEVLFQRGTDGALTQYTPPEWTPGQANAASLLMLCRPWMPSPGPNVTYGDAVGGALHRLGCYANLF